MVPYRHNLLLIGQRRRAVIPGAARFAATRNPGFIKTVIIVAGVIVGTGLADATAATYRWRDAEGKVHYSDSPPQGVKSERMEESAAPFAVDTQSARERLQRLLEDQRKREEIRRNDAEDLKRQQAAKEAEEAARMNRCLHAQQQLAVLSTPRPVFRPNAKGEYEFLDDTSRPMEIARINAEIAQYCGTSKEDIKAQQQTARCPAYEALLKKMETDRRTTSDIHSMKERIKAECR